MRLLGLALGAAMLCPAELHRIYVEERTDVAEGRAFGAAGPYERITGRAHFRVDPNAAANRGIADVDRAPRNSEGLVEFSADFHMLKPRDPARGNSTLLFEVVNRGNKLMHRTFQFGAGSTNDPQTAADLGDAYLLEQGYSLVWLGWQFDVPRQPGLLRLYTPRVAGVTGLVRSEFIPAAHSDHFPLAERDHVAYEPVDTQQAELTVRDTPEGKKEIIPRSRWTYDGTARLRVDGGLQPGRVYEFIYTAKEPAVVGLGLAAVRDLVSYLKHEGGPMLLGDQRRFLKRAIGFGTSQSGRFLRTFVYDGFNADEKGRKVFDGLWPHVAGAGRGSFNFRFAQPSRDAQPFGNFFYPTDVFPFADADVDDAGNAKGLLDRAVAQNAVPKIFYTNGSYEYWGRAAWLIHRRPPTAQTRIYFLTGTQHGAGTWPPSDTASRYPANPNDYRFVMRGLLKAMDAWLRDGVEPPATVFPAGSNLVRPSELKFSHAPVPRRPHLAWHVDHGASFEKQPPVPGTAFDLWVPAVDQDGNEIAGVRLPELVHPLGVYTGWNYRKPGTGAPNEMVAFLGSFFPLTRAEIQRRYSGKSEYVGKVAAAARSLADRRYLLDRDVAALEQRAARMWDDLTR
ncbi:MAG TPA: alpha/beta hydrolase domain-containing protein [Bryobacteraceae bacterium]|nr:alpha/beta hydrolase domain-containing protein [Bryobacteraceae bacterium]